MIIKKDAKSEAAGTRGITWDSNIEIRGTLGIPRDSMKGIIGILGIPICPKGARGINIVSQNGKTGSLGA